MATTAKWPRFPEPLRDAFEDVWQDVASLHAKWNLYIGLFGHPENIEVLNQTTPAAFQLIEESLRADMTMAFSRLLDPAKHGKNENLSLQRLMQEFRPHLDDTHFGLLETQVKEIDGPCEDILKWRNKKVGHNDLNTALQYHANPLPHIKRSTIEKALESIRDFMNGLQRHFEDGVTVYEHPTLRGTGEQLVGLLRQLLQHIEHEKIRMLGPAFQDDPS